MRLPLHDAPVAAPVQRRRSARLPLPPARKCICRLQRSSPNSEMRSITVLCQARRLRCRLRCEQADSRAKGTGVGGGTHCWPLPTCGLALLHCVTSVMCGACARCGHASLCTNTVLKLFMSFSCSKQVAAEEHELTRCGRHGKPSAPCPGPTRCSQPCALSAPARLRLRELDVVLLGEQLDNGQVLLGRVPVELRHVVSGGGTGVGSLAFSLGSPDGQGRRGQQRSFRGN